MLLCEKMYLYWMRLVSATGAAIAAAGAAGIESIIN